MPVPHHSVFSQAGCLSWRLTNSVKALKAIKALKALSTPSKGDNYDALKRKERHKAYSFYSQQPTSYMVMCCPSQAAEHGRTCPHPKWHIDRFLHFCRLTDQTILPGYSLDEASHTGLALRNYRMKSRHKLILILCTVTSRSLKQKFIFVPHTLQVRFKTVD